MLLKKLAPENKTNSGIGIIGGYSSMIWYTIHHYEINSFNVTCTLMREILICSLVLNSKQW